MHIPFDILKARIGSAVARSASHSELAELVHISRAIVQAHLEYVRGSVSRLCESQGLSIEDLAYDCLGDAFLRNDENRFISLESFVSSFEGGFESHDGTEVFLAYRSLLTKVAEQHMAGLFAQSDPAAGKIYRNTKAAAVKTGLFSLRSEFRGVVLSPVNCETLDHLEQFPVEELERAVLERLGGRRTTNELVHALYSTVVSQTVYRRTIPLYQITGMFKRLVAQDLKEEQTNEALGLEGLSQAEINVIKEEVRTVLRQKILVTYVMKGKLDPSQTKAILKAFDDLLDDWVDANVASDGLLTYLQKHRDIDTKDYLCEYRPKMEYLLRIARDEFQARLMKEL